MLTPKDFQEIGHAGGQFTVNVKTDDSGQRSIQLGFRQCRPNPLTIFGVHVLPQGIPVGMASLGGIGAPTGAPPVPGALVIFLASDSTGKFGHACPRCKGYWRSDGPVIGWRMTCPYCRLRLGAHDFLTTGQRTYLMRCCELIHQAMSSEQDGESVVDMDEIADAVWKDGEKPKFYYAEESQQKRFNCHACGTFNDIIGRYGYCSSCGTHNGAQEVKAATVSISERAQSAPESAVRDLVSEFDSLAGSLAQQFTRLIPMTPRRRKDWERKKFHNLANIAESLLAVFDVNILKGLSKDDEEFLKRQFHRRHVYEHKGGVVDEKYIQDSGDTTVKLNQRIAETAESATRTAALVTRLAENLCEGFQAIFPVEEKPIKAYEATVARSR